MKYESQITLRGHGNIPGIIKDFQYPEIIPVITTIDSSDIKLCPNLIESAL